MALADPPIRAALVGTVVADLISDDPDAFYVDEMGLCEHRARVDLAVFNGHIHGFEIKSDRDTFARLDGQAEVYNAVLDRVTLVVGERHIDEARTRASEWWGLMVAAVQGGAVVLQSDRPTADNPARDPEMISHLLWRDEALGLLERLGADRGVRSKSRYHVCKRLAGALPLEELAREVRLTIKGRGDWRQEWEG